MARGLWRPRWRRDPGATSLRRPPPARRAHRIASLDAASLDGREPLCRRLVAVARRRHSSLDGTRLRGPARDRQPRGGPRQAPAPNLDSRLAGQRVDRGWRPDLGRRTGPGSSPPRRSAGDRVARQPSRRSRTRPVLARRRHQADRGEGCHSDSPTRWQSPLAGFRPLPKRPFAGRHRAARGTRHRPERPLLPSIITPRHAGLSTLDRAWTIQRA